MLMRSLSLKVTFTNPHHMITEYVSSLSFSYWWFINRFLLLIYNPLRELAVISDGHTKVVCFGRFPQNNSIAVCYILRLNVMFWQ